MLKLAPGFYLDRQLLVIDSRRDAVRVLQDHDLFRQWNARMIARGEVYEERPASFVADAPDNRRSAPGTDGPFASAPTPIFLDQPEHTRVKALVVRSWQAGRAAQRLRPRVRSLADSLLSPSATRPIEFMAEVALPVSCATLAWFFGDDPARWTRLAAEHPAVWGARGPAEESLRQVYDFQVGIWELVANRGPSCRDGDATSRMLHPRRVTDDRLTSAEIQTLILQMAFLPNNLTIHLLGEVAVRVLGDPGARRELRAGDKAASMIVDQVLRDSPPLRRVFRRTARHGTVQGVDVPAGCGVSVGLCAADGPDLLGGPASGPRAPGEEKRGQLAFGFGIHSCPGAALAITQAEVVAAALGRLERLRMLPYGCARDADGFVHGPRALWLEEGR
jgi:hypothetical protein